MPTFKTRGLTGSFRSLVSDTALESGREASAAIFRSVLQNTDDTRFLRSLLTEYTVEDFHRFPTSAATLLSATLDMRNLREDRMRMADRIRPHYHEKFGSSAVIDQLVDHPAQEWKSADDDGAGHYTCIICGAKPGHQCSDRTGTEYSAVHAERGEVGKLPPPENCSQCGRFVAWKDYTADDWTVQGHAKGTGCRKNDH